jgi:hypothetical protein
MIQNGELLVLAHYCMHACMCTEHAVLVSYDISTSNKELERRERMEDTGECEPAYAVSNSYAGSRVVKPREMRGFGEG